MQQQQQQVMCQCSPPQVALELIAGPNAKNPGKRYWCCALDRQNEEAKSRSCKFFHLEGSEVRAKGGYGGRGGSFVRPSAPAQSAYAAFTNAPTPQHVPQPQWNAPAQVADTSELSLLRSDVAEIKRTLDELLKQVVQMNLAQSEVEEMQR